MESGVHRQPSVDVSLSPAWKSSEPLQFRFLWRLHYGVRASRIISMGD